MQSKRAQTMFIGAIALLLVALVCAGLVTAMLIRQNNSPTGAKDSVVFLISEYIDPVDNEVYFMSGTAFAIGATGQNPSYFITSYHVIEDVFLNGGSLSLVYSGASGDAIAPKIVKVNPEKDLAILQIPEPTDKRKPLVIRRQADVESGESVYALGYPAVSRAAANYSPINVQDISMTRGIISRKTVMANTTIEAYEMDTAIHGGNSGGPLVDEQGRVLGVNAFGRTDTDNMNFAVQIDEAIPMIRELELAVTISGSVDPVLIILIVVGALALIAGIVLLVVSLKGKGSKAGAVGPAPAKGAAAALRGLNGQFAGQKFELKERVVLGRDKARCNIVFEANTPGVSSQHCAVFYDRMNGQFVLEDLGSSYGTFKASGQKLAQGVPVRLASGESFYLGTPDQSFAVGVE